MASIGDTTRPEYIYDQAIDTWIPVGIGPHSHTPAAIGAIASSIVTTKGDIIAATGSGLVVRQGVGADGSYLMADSSQADGLSYAGPSITAGKNGVINGGFDIWQRGTSFAFGATGTTYTADRWANYSDTDRTLSRQLTNDTTNLPNIQYCARIQRNSGSTITTVLVIGNSFESVNSTPFVGKTVTLSFYARAGANFSAAGNAFTGRVYSGTGTDQNVVASYTGANAVAVANANLTTTWQRFTATGIVPTNATELSVELRYQPTGTAGVNDYAEVTGVQLELGSVATLFSRAGGSIGGELALCQRYYCRLGGANASDGYYTYGTGYVASTTRAYGITKLPTTMRTSPTFSSFATASSFGVHTGISTLVAASSLSVDRTNTDVLWWNMVTAASLTAGYGIFFINNNNTNAYIELSAEL